MAVGVAAVRRDLPGINARGGFNPLELFGEMIAFVDPAGGDRHIDDDALLIVNGGVLLVAGPGRSLRLSVAK